MLEAPAETDVGAETEAAAEARKHEPTAGAAAAAATAAAAGTADDPDALRVSKGSTFAECPQCGESVGVPLMGHHMEIECKKGPTTAKAAAKPKKKKGKRKKGRPANPRPLKEIASRFEAEMKPISQNYLDDF